MLQFMNDLFRTATFFVNQRVDRLISVKTINMLKNSNRYGKIRRMYEMR